MTVKELISALLDMPPHLPVHILLSHVYTSDSEGTLNKVNLDESDSIKVYDCKHRGSYVLIESE